MSDWALHLMNGGYLAASNNAAYNVGAGDFTLEAWVLPHSAGTIVSRKPTGGGKGNGGFLWVLKPDGSFKLTTDDGSGFYEVNSAATDAMDGMWHHVAGVRQAGQLRLYFDGAPLASSVRSNASTPLNINNSLRLLIGATDQLTESYNHYSGLLDEVRVWNYARDEGQISRYQYQQLAGNEQGLVGYWMFDFNIAADLSPVRSSTQKQGTVGFTTPGATVTKYTSSSEAFLFTGQYACSARSGRAPGDWHEVPDLYLTQSGRVVFSGTLLQGARFDGNTLSSPAAGNPAAVTITFKLKSDDPSFWPSGAPSRDLFEGTIQYPGQSPLDFRGWARDVSSPCSFIQSQLDGLVFDPGAATPGTALTLRQKGAGHAQHFCRTNDGFITHMSSGLVLDLPDGAAAPGAGIILSNRVAGRAQQKWRVAGDGYITSAANPSLVVAAGGAGASPAQVVVSDKQSPPSADQIWYSLASRQFIFNVGNGMVLEIKDGATTESAPVVVAPKKGRETQNQVWYLVDDFIVSSLNGYVVGLGDSDSRPVVMQRMRASDNDGQKWTYQNGRFVSRLNGMALDLDTPNTGAAVVAAPPDQTRPTQVWSLFEPAAGTTPAGSASVPPPDSGVERRDDGAGREYIITVKTSDSWFAGYDGEVELTLMKYNGRFQQGVTLKHSTTHKDPFERGNEDRFVIPLYYFGPIENILLRTSGNAFLGKSWKVDWVKIYDPYADQLMVFDFHGEWVGAGSGRELTYRLTLTSPVPVAADMYPAEGFRGWIDHTFVRVTDDVHGKTYFDCAGGHSGSPATLGVVTSKALLTDVVRMATGKDLGPDNPWKDIYGHNDVTGKETCGIRASGFEHWDGQCHQMTNRLLYAALPQQTLDVAAPRRPAAYGLSVMLWGPYGLEFERWCTEHNFTPPPASGDPIFTYIRRYFPFELARTVLYYANSLRSLWTNDKKGEPQGEEVKAFIQSLAKEGIGNQQIALVTDLNRTQIEHDEL